MNELASQVFLHVVPILSAGLVINGTKYVGSAIYNSMFGNAITDGIEATDDEGASYKGNDIVLPDGYSLGNFNVIKFDDDSRSFIHAFYFLLHNKKANVEELNDFIKKNITEPLLALPDNDYLKVRYVMYQNDMHKDSIDTKGLFKNYKKVTHAMKLAATKLMRNIKIDEMLEIIETCAGTDMGFVITDISITTLKANILRILESNQAFGDMNQVLDREFMYNKVKKPTDKTQDFTNLLKMYDTNPKDFYQKLKLCKDIVSYNVAATNEYKALNKKYNEFIQSLLSPNFKNENYSRRNGVGDTLIALLANTPNFNCVTFLNHSAKPHTYGCQDRKNYTGSVIIYKIDKTGHCVLLVPKNLSKNSGSQGASSGSPQGDSSQVSSSQGASSGSPQGDSPQGDGPQGDSSQVSSSQGNGSQVDSPKKYLQEKEDCNKYDEVFETDPNKGGSTRKRGRHRYRSRKRVTRKPRRRPRHRKSKSSRRRTKRENYKKA